MIRSLVTVSVGEPRDEETEEKYPQESLSTTQELRQRRLRRDVAITQRREGHD